MNSLFHPRKQSISLTALIDVVFILLMFFMLTTSFKKWYAIDIASPVQSSDIKADNKDPQIFILDIDNSLTQATNDWFISNIYQLDNNKFNHFDKAAAILVPKEDCQLQLMLDAVKQLKSVGFKQVNLASPLPT